MVDAFFPEKLYKILLYNPFDYDLLEAIFVTSLDVRKEARDIAINLLFTCLEGEYFGTDAESGRRVRNIQLSYTWFIARVIKSFRNNTHISDLEYRKSFKQAVDNRQAILNATGFDSQDIENYIRKLQMLSIHLIRLVAASFDMVKTEERFKENEV